MTDDIKKLIESLRNEAHNLDLEENRYGGTRTHPFSPRLREAADALEAEHETAEERFRILVTVTNNAMRFSAERDALREQIEGHGGWDEWIAEHVRLEEENDAFRTAIQPVLDAWNIPGIRPDYHDSMMFALNREWPTLYSALLSLSRAIDTKEKTDEP